MQLGRGRRSAIGTFGFFHGGFLADRGVDIGNPVSPLEVRTEFPKWPIALIQFDGWKGSHGLVELAAFDKIATSKQEERDRMARMLCEGIVPAVYAHDYKVFSESVYEFGCQSGRYYRDVQGGDYYNPSVAQTVDALRSAGIRGVIQSSWGPTLAVFLNDPGQLDVVRRIASSIASKAIVQLTEACNRGFEIMDSQTTTCRFIADIEEKSCQN
ncbi:MAG: hypothetical protein R3C03_02540 [Pirellulaceae bacterium]